MKLLTIKNFTDIKWADSPNQKFYISAAHYDKRPDDKDAYILEITDHEDAFACDRLIIYREILSGNIYNNSGRIEDVGGFKYVQVEYIVKDAKVVLDDMQISCFTSKKQLLKEIEDRYFTK